MEFRFLIRETLGLFGPVILMTKGDYQTIGGHESVKRTIIEDIALGKQLKRAGLKYHLYVGKGDISYRMYSDGFRSLFNGWTKNIALGASNMSFFYFHIGLFVYNLSHFRSLTHCYLFNKH